MKATITLFLILLLGLVLRLYKVDIPLADHHSWRQADSAAVIKNLASSNFDILHPKWNNFTATNAKGLPNPNRYFFEDFPLSFDIYPAVIFRILGANVVYLRLSAIVFSLLTIFFLYLLVEKISSSKTALIAAFLYAVLPFSIFFSRGIFQEIPLNFYAVATLYFLYCFLSQKEGKRNLVFFVLSILFNSLLFLTKPYSLVILLPEFFLFYSFFRLSLFGKKYFWIFFTASLIPFLLWWFWVSRFPEGIPYSGWLLNEGNIRFKGSFFYWIFSQRIGTLILGVWGVLFFGLGLLLFGNGKDSLFYFWFISLLVYVSVVAKGNVTHDYYQIPLLPVIAYFWAKGADFLFSTANSVKLKMIRLFVVFIFLAFSLAFSWYEIRGFYNLKSGVDLAGDFIDRNVPKSSLVIAGDGADPTLLYNTNRLGWTVGYGSVLENTQETIQQLEKQGANYYVTTTVSQIKNTPFERYLRDNYLLVKETDQFIVFSLSK